MLVSNGAAGLLLELEVDLRFDLEAQQKRWSEPGGLAGQQCSCGTFGGNKRTNPLIGRLFCRPVRQMSHMLTVSRYIFIIITDNNIQLYLYCLNCRPVCNMYILKEE